MARIPVREVSGPNAIVPVAQPVDTYVRPADPGRSPLNDLAEGLAAFDSGLSGYIGGRKEKDKENDRARAVVDFNRNNQTGYDEAVRQGKIPASASPSYMEWYKKAQGDLAGRKLAAKYNLDYQQWSGRNDAEDADFDAWQAQWMAENVGDEQDPEILKGLAPHLEAMGVGGADAFVKDRNDRITKGAMSTSGALVSDTVRGGIQDGKATGTTDYDALWGSVEALRAEALSKGTLAQDYDKMLVAAIIQQAEESGDEEVLELLDRKLPGTDHALSSDPANRQEIMDSKTRINAGVSRQATAEREAQERREKAEHEASWAEAVEHIYQGEEVPEELIVKLSRRDGEARHKVAKTAKEFKEAAHDEDKTALLDVFQQIDQGAGIDFVNRMKDQGVIQDPETYRKAVDRIKSIKKETEDGGVLTTPTYKDTVKLITGATTNQFDPFGDGRLSQEGMEALYDYRQMLIDWGSKNPEATLLEKEKVAREIGQTIQSRIQEDMTYTSEADQAKADQAAAQEPTVEQAPAPADEGGYLSGIADFFGLGGGDEPVPPELEGVPEERQGAIKSLSEKKGISLGDARKRVEEKIKELQERNGIDPETTNSVNPEDQSSLEGLLDKPPVQLAGVSVGEGRAENAVIRDLVAQAEGTDAGAGYNETLGYGKLTDGPVNLTGMTLDQVDALQSQMLAHPDNQWNSSAVGRYQVVQTTLREAREALGLSGSQKYDKETQNRIADYLLEKRGIGQVLDGSMTLDQFTRNMGNEWQSFAAGINGASGAQAALRGIMDASTGQSVAGGGDSLVSSSKRGYNPDLEHLKPELTSRVSTLQQAWGRDLPIVSGFRDKARNARAGGAKKSQHTHGNAVDIDVSSLSKAERIELISLASSQGFTGIGVYANSLHLDLGKKRAWGPSHGKGSVPKWARAAINAHMNG